MLDCPQLQHVNLDERYTLRKLYLQQETTELHFCLRRLGLPVPGDAPVRRSGSSSVPAASIASTEDMTGRCLHCKERTHILSECPELGALPRGERVSVDPACLILQLLSCRVLNHACLDRLLCCAVHERRLIWKRQLMQPPQDRAEYLTSSAYARAGRTRARLQTAAEEDQCQQDGRNLLPL